MPPDVTASRLSIPELILLNADEAVSINQRRYNNRTKRYYDFMICGESRNQAYIRNKSISQPAPKPRSEEENFH